MILEIDYQKICKISDLKEKEGKRFFVDDVDVAIFKVEGNVFAVSNVCPHNHSALIYDGFIEDDYVGCPVHGWMFNLKSGNQPSGARGLDVFPLKIVDDEVFVLVKQEKLRW